MKRIVILLSILILFSAMSCACAVGPSDIDPNKPIYIDYPPYNPPVPQPHVYINDDLQPEIPMFDFEPWIPIIEME